MLFVFFCVALLLGAECRPENSSHKPIPESSSIDLETTVASISTDKGYEVTHNFYSTLSSAGDNSTPDHTEDPTTEAISKSHHTPTPEPSNKESTPYAPGKELDSEEAETSRAPTVTCQNDTSFSRLPPLNSLRHADIYRHYHLGPDEFNAKFLLDALERIVKHPADEIADEMWKINDIRFLSGEFDEHATFGQLAHSALNDSKGTIFEDLIRFKVANALQFHAVVYLKILIATDFNDYQPKDKIHKFAILRDIRSARKKRQLGKVVRILRYSLSKGDVPYVEIEDAMELLKQFTWMGESFDKLLNEQMWIADKIREYLEKYAHDSYSDESSTGEDF
ncbi:hypothetical protein ANCCAN_07836 [Ancylostoma caninum]|uniref:Uncharacterized protein n=1 Tax=Ancylostoma caninum TaxID=29170 RepID=A0A368GT97_ANCCA|nr:hypothetical protein ANCCAN_07836 [Ancylostoma caninum]